MSVLDMPLESLPATQAIRAAADVLEVDEGLGFCASVLLVPGALAIARLDRALDGAPHEGRVLREVMLTVAGARGPGYHEWRLPLGAAKSIT